MSYGEYGNRGGHLPSDSPQNSPSGTDASPSKGKGKSTGDLSLTPVTIKQLGQAVQIGDSFKVDGHELNMITIVGAVMKVNQSSTHINYEIDDGTGVIQVRIWIESDDSSNHISRQLNTVDINKYVRVVGRLSVFNDERNLIAFRVIPITDYNEVTFHHLEVINVHLYRVRPSNNQFNNSYSGSTNTYGNNNNNNNFVPYVNGNAPQGGNFTDVQRAILALLRENQHSQEGVAVKHVVTTLNNSFNERSILEALDFLMNEGHIYTGIDDDHIKASQSE